MGQMLSRQQPQPALALPPEAAIAEIRTFFQDRRFTPEDLKALLPRIRQAINSSDSQLSPNNDPTSDTVQKVFLFLDTQVIPSLDAASKEAGTSFQIQDFKLLHLEKAAETTLQQILQGVGSLHWIVCAFSLVAYILKLRQQGEENEKDIDSTLKRIVFTAEHIIDLAPEVVDRNNNITDTSATRTLEDATKEIATIAFQCCWYKHWSKFNRFSLAKVVAENLQKIDKTLTNIQDQLSAITNNELLKRISRPWKQIPDIDKDAVDMDTRVQEVMGLINNSDVCVVVLYGMGGVGKTTLMKGVAYALEGEGYSYHPIKLSMEPEIQKVQESLLKSLTERAATVNGAEDGRVQLTQTLQRIKDPQEKLLICIDDVWKTEHVTKLLPQETISNPGNVKLLMTTRNMAIKDAFRSWQGFNEMSTVKTYKVDFLSLENSRRLLRKALRIDVASASNPSSLGKEEQLRLETSLLEACKGHPLAIKLAGKYIETSRGERDAWEHAIRRMTSRAWNDTLDGGKDDELSECLDYVLDSLSEPVKGAFLDIVAFLRGRRWDEVGYYVGSSALKALENRCLVERDHRSEVKVHDLLVAMAEWNTPENSRLTTMEQLLGLLRRENTNELNAVEAIHISCFGLLDEIIESGVSLGGIAKMSNLRILKLDGYSSHLSSRPFPELGVCPRAPLRVLYFDLGRCRLRSFPCDRLTSLEVRFHESSVQTWSKCIKWEDLKALRKLRLWGVSQCVVNALDDSCIGIKWGTLLEELALDGEFALLPRTLQGLRNLRSLRLTIRTGSSFNEERACMELPQGMQDLGCLEDLDISGPVQLRPQDLQGHPALTDLRLSECRGVAEALADQDASRQLSSSLIILRLSSLPVIRSVPTALGKLSKLRYLSLDRCRDLEVFPEGICGHLQALKIIGVYSCDKLSYWPRDLHSSRSLARVDEIEMPKNIRDLTRGTHVGVKLNNPRLPTIIARDFPEVAREVRKEMAQYPEAAERRVWAVQRLLQHGKLIDHQGNELPACAAESRLNRKVVGLLFVNLDTPELNWDKLVLDNARQKPFPDDVKSICQELAKQHKEMQYVVVKDPYKSIFPSVVLDGQWRPYLPLEELPEHQHWLSVSMLDPTTRAHLALAFRYTIQADTIQAYGSIQQDRSIACDSKGTSFVFTVLKEGDVHTQWDALAKFGWWRGEAYPFTEERMQSLNPHMLGSYLRPTDCLLDSNGKETKVDDCQLSGKPTIFLFCSGKGSTPVMSWLSEKVLPCCVANFIHFQNPRNDGYVPITSPWLRYPTRDSGLLEGMWSLFAGLDWKYRPWRTEDEMVIFDEQGKLLPRDSRLDALLVLGACALSESRASLEAELDRQLTEEAGSFRNLFFHGCDTFIHRGRQEQHKSVINVEARLGVLFVDLRGRSDEGDIEWLGELKHTYLTMNESSSSSSNKVIEIVQVNWGDVDLRMDIPWLAMPHASSQVLRWKLRAICNLLNERDASDSVRKKWLPILEGLPVDGRGVGGARLLMLGADGQPVRKCGESLLHSHGCKRFYPLNFEYDTHKRLWLWKHRTSCQQNLVLPTKTTQAKDLMCEEEDPCIFLTVLSCCLVM